MVEISELTQKILDFRSARDWAKFHTPKDMVLSLLLEAAELGEHLQWKDNQEFSAYLKEHRQEIGAELADVLYWVLLISHDFGVDLEKAFTEKMSQNEIKYPIQQAKGKSTKYTELV